MTETNNQFRPVFSGHETFSLRYGWLKKIYDLCEFAEKSGKTAKNILASDEAIVLLGVGKNMVNSMQYWAKYCGLFDTTAEKDIKLTPFAKWLLADGGKDPWLENYTSLWFFHWNLTRKNNFNGDCLFTYYWLFNHYNSSTFDKELLQKRIIDCLGDTFDVPDNKLPAENTLKRDIDCLINVYAGKNTNGKVDDESIESPLTELNLITPITKRDLFQINRGFKPNLSVNTFLFALFMFWKEYSPNTKTISFESLCYQTSSVGRVFVLNEDAVSDFMQKAPKASRGLLEYSETAGMKELILSKEIKDFEQVAYDFLKEDY